MSKDYASVRNLRNELREKLKAMNLNADDMSERTLRTVKKIIATCEEKNRIHESSYVNYCTVSEAVGMSRKQIAENEDYRAIVDYYYTAHVRQNDQRIKNLQDQVERLKAAEKDREARIDREFDLQAKVADLTIRLEDMQREKSLSDEALRKANEKNAELESQIAAIRTSKYCEGGRLLC